MTTPDVTLGELGRRLDAIAADISSFRTEAVMRGEYEAHRTAIDREIRDIKADIARRDDQDSQKRLPWTTIASTLATVAGLVLTVLLLIFVAQSQMPL